MNRVPFRAWDEHFHASLSRSLASILFVTTGCLQLLTLAVPNQGQTNLAGVAFVALFNISLAATVQRMAAADFASRRALLYLVPLVTFSTTAYIYFAHTNPQTYSIFYIVCFVWLGVSCRRGTSLMLTPLLLATFPIPFLIDGSFEWENLGALIYLAPACILVGETIAWIVMHVRVAEASAQRERVGAELGRTQERYLALIEQLPSATYVLTERRDGNPPITLEYVSPQIEHLLGIPADAWMADFRMWEKHVHPDDLARVQAEDELTYESSSAFEQEYRMVHEDGSIVWVLESARPLLHEASAPGEVTWLGQYHDITQLRQAEATLRETDILYRTLIEQIPLITYLEAVDRENGTSPLIYVSPQIMQIVGYGPEEWAVPGHWDRIVHSDDRDQVRQLSEHSDRSLEPFSADYRVIAPDGRTVWVHDESVVVFDADERPKYWHGFIRDITRMKEAEDQLRRSESEFRLLFYRNPLPAIVYDRETLRVLEVNDKAIAHYGFSRHAFTLLSLSDLVTGEHTEDDSGRESTMSLQHHRTAYGGEISIEATMHELTFRDRPAVLLIAQDVTARNALQSDLRRQAFQDVLTGLPNRALFQNRLEQALEAKDEIAVLFVDLDDFKRINDSLGHTVGDAVLVAVAQRLMPCIRADDTLARLGGDEFTILLRNCTDLEALSVVQRCYDVLAEPITVNGRDIVINPSIGIALGDSTIAVPDELLRRADVAMYQAKRAGKARHIVFNPIMDTDNVLRLDLETDLRRALQQDQLTLHYQPIVDIASGRLASVEALVRWQHPQRGLISPAVFIPVAEESGLILPLGAWVLAHACATMQRWRLAGVTGLAAGLSVNVSARQFQDPNLCRRVAEAIAMSGINPGDLTLEITESVALDDLSRTDATLLELKRLGVRLAIDDFGTGYSGLSYLQRAQIDTIKIDKSYVDNICTNAGDEALVRAVTAYAGTLGVRVVAEGVEREDQLARLQELGITHAQGYYFARPLPAAEMEQWVAAPLSLTA